MEEKDLIYGENGLIYKAETILRHKNRLNEIAERKAKQKIESFNIQKSKQKVPKNEIIKPEEFVNAYREKQRNFSYYKLRKNSSKVIDLEENSVILVLRIKGDKNLSTQQRKILRKMGLFRAHEAHIFKVDESLKNHLKAVENFVIYGKINRKTIKQLISKRGKFLVEKKVELISSNKIVEDILGNFGIVCVEDMVGEISGGSKNFSEVKNALS